MLLAVQNCILLVCFTHMIFDSFSPFNFFSRLQIEDPLLKLNMIDCYQVLGRFHLSVFINELQALQRIFGPNLVLKTPGPI